MPAQAGCCPVVENRIRMPCDAVRRTCWDRSRARATARSGRVSDKVERGNPISGARKTKQGFMSAFRIIPMHRKACSCVWKTHFEGKSKRCSATECDVVRRLGTSLLGKCWGSREEICLLTARSAKGVHKDLHVASDLPFCPGPSECVATNPGSWLHDWLYLQSFLSRHGRLNVRNRRHT
jgi:hypothetical protein